MLAAVGCGVYPDVETAGKKLAKVVDTVEPTPELAAKYEELSLIHIYLDEKVLDHVNGSWFHQLDRENNLLETVWPGKSDIYHALQDVYKRQLLDSAIQNPLKERSLQPPIRSTES